MPKNKSYFKDKNPKNLKHDEPEHGSEYKLEISDVISKILNIPEDKILKHIDLFTDINPHNLNSLYYLGKLNNEQDRISAVHALEFIYSFNKKIY